MFHLLFTGGVCHNVCEVRRKLVGALIHHVGLGDETQGLRFGGRCFSLAPELYLYSVSLKSIGDQVHSGSFGLEWWGCSSTNRIVRCL